MKQVVNDGPAGVRQDPGARKPAVEAAPRVGRHNADSRIADSETRCSVDPMRETDRYRLVTPYVDSIKDL